MISLCLLACTPEPDPAFDHIPQIKGVFAEVKMNMCTLSCTLSAKLDSRCEVGFYYGLTADSMKKVPVESASSKDFVLMLTSLYYETDYVYKAYVSNGRNEICSNIERFSTGQEPYMYLIDKEEHVSYHRSEINVNLLTNVAYDVIIPDGVDWVSYHDVVARFYVVVEGNTSSQPRTCELVFNSLYHDYQQTFRIIQEGYDMNSDDLVISREGEVLLDHTSTPFTISVGGKVEFDVKIPSSADWLSVSRQGRECTFTPSWNGTYDPRRCDVSFLRKSDNHSITLLVIQAGQIPTN